MIVEGPVIVPVLTGLVLLVPIWRSVRLNRGWAIFDPRLTVAGMLALILSLSPLLRRSRGIYFTYGLQVPFDLARADSLALFAAVAFVLGTLFSRDRLLSGRVRRRLNSDSAVGNARLLLILATTTSAVLFVAYASRVGWSALLAGRTRTLSTAGQSEYLKAAPVVVPAALASIIARSPGWVTIRRGHLALALSTLTVSTFFLFLTGSRRFALVGLLFPAVTFLLMRARPPKARSIAFAFVLVLFLSSATSIARSAGAREQRGGLGALVVGLVSSPGEVLDRATVGPDSSQRDFLAVHLDSVDRRGADFGFGILQEAVYKPFPSAITGKKPPTSKEESLIDLFGEGCVSSGGLCPDPTIVGSFYSAGLWWSVGLGMFASGSALSLIWRRWATRRRAKDALLVAATALLGPILARKGLLDPAVHLLYFLVPAWLSLRFLALSKKNTRPVPPEARTTVSL